MAKYIDREKIIAKLEEINPVDFGGYMDYEIHVGAREALRFVKYVVDEIPAADVAPVVHGRWRENGLGYTCSSCNKLHITSTSMRTLEFEFCPYCGAKMDKEEPNGR